MSETAKLTRGPIRGHLVSQTLPAIIGVASLMSVGLIDAYFIGQLGSAQLAAISFVFPISVAVVSLGVGTMVGINSVVSRTLGSGDLARARQRGNFGILFAVALGLMMSALLYLLLDPLFGLMQADDELLPIIREYMVPFSLGLPVILTIMGVNGVLRGQGEAKKTSYVSVTYAVANMILDPILITGAFGFEGFGIAGAAYATIVGWSIGIALGLFLLSKTDIPFQPRRIGGLDFGSSLNAIGKVAGPAAFSNAINPIGLAVLTALLASQGEAAVAGFGAAGRLQSFVVVPLLALSGSIGAIVGQNWGADMPERSRLAMLEAGAFCIGYGLLIAVLLWSTGGWFADIFTDDAEVMANFTSYLSIAAWGYAGYGLLIVGNGALNAIDRASVSLTQSFARVFLVMLPFAWVMRGDWGAEAIYAAELTANLVGGAIAAGAAWWFLGRRPRMVQAAE
ncbi:MATE family efflux transporter [Altererythrobacter sp. MF3-039]|uniref:MATE family efflux transporter n=1 Tax=Altererythrobacter sp. MF3-039 TaxID=3252901 RepID=UPI00390C6A9F